MKVLFLPGFLQNGVRLARSAAELQKALEQLGFTVDYMDPPQKLQFKEQVGYLVGATETEAEKKWKSIIARDFNRCWWDFRQGDDYDGFDDSIEKAIDYIKANGPYDGIMGFSQGSSMATILTNCIHTLLPEHPYFKFSILFSGMAFTEPVIANTKINLYDIDGIESYASKIKLKAKFAKYFTSPPRLPTKVIVVYGSTDPVLPPLRTQYLAYLFKDSAKEIEFPGGHYVPKDEETIGKIVAEVSALKAPQANL